MNYSGYKNVHPNGKVIDPHEQVKDSYGVTVSPNHINEAGVITPPGSVLDNNWDLDDDDSGYVYSSAPIPLSLKAILAFVLIPVILQRLFDFFTPFMEDLLVPSVAIVIGLTFILPNVKKVLTQQHPKGDLYKASKKKYQRLWIGNLIFSLIITYPIVSPILYKWTEWVASLFSGNKSVLISLFSVVLLVLLYCIRFTITMILIPAIQWALWKYAGNLFENQFTTKFVKWYMRSK